MTLRFLSKKKKHDTEEYVHDLSDETVLIINQHKVNIFFLTKKKNKYHDHKSTQG